MTIAVDAIVDVLALAMFGVHLLVGAFQGIVPTTPAPPPAAIEIEMTIEPPQPAVRPDTITPEKPSIR